MKLKMVYMTPEHDYLGIWDDVADCLNREWKRQGLAAVLLAAKNHKKDRIDGRG
jgi:hypothetical protein